MFEITTQQYSRGVSYISNGNDNYLHSDGCVYNVREYFPTKKIAQKVLDKFFPKPEHKWKHGDVFKSGLNHHLLMVYLEILNKQPIAFCLESPISGPTTGIYGDLADATFLFNIKEKI